MPTTQFERVKLQLDRNRSAGIKPGSQADVANYLGVSKTYMRDVLRGERLGPKGRVYLEKALAFIGIN